jgi:zinc/manganese transport system substrate-binding protein
MQKFRCNFQRRFINALLYFCLLFPFAVEAKLNIVTTTTDLAAIVREIGGDKVKVVSLTKGNQNPHYIDPKPSLILRVNKADVLINVGASLEVGWLPTLIENSRNGVILTGASGRVDASARIRLLEAPTTRIDRSMGDVHPQGNPHYWLDPRNGVIIAEQIAERLETLDPDNATIYDQNLNRFRQDLEAKIENWETRMPPFRNQEIVTYHKQWEYLTDWLGLSIVGYIEVKPGIPPSPKHTAKLIQQMRSKQIQVLFSSNLVNPKVSRRVAGKGGAKLVILPTAVGGSKAIKTYADLFEHIISKLETAFKE